MEICFIELIPEVVGRLLQTNRDAWTRIEMFYELFCWNEVLERRRIVRER